MSNKVFIGVGHGGKDPGAVSGGFKESEINLTMAQAMAAELSRNGVEVKLSRVREEDDTLAQEIAESKAFCPNFAVEVHNNAGGGDGFEIYRQTGKFASISIKLAESIECEVKKIGQNSRGIKTKINSEKTDYFGWLRQNNCPAVLCEGFFVDNQTDRQIADTKAEQERFGVAYARGVLKCLGVNSKPETAPPSNSNTFYVAQVGCFRNKSSAEQYASKLKKLAVDGVPVQAFVVKKVG